MTTTQGTSPNAGSVIDKLDEFTEYCFEFYLLDPERPSLYPFASDTEICNAVRAHMTDPNPLFPFLADSTDREAVRDRILADRHLIGCGETNFDKAVEMGKHGIPSRLRNYDETLGKIYK
jgi:hypothetical protein